MKTSIILLLLFLISCSGQRVTKKTRTLSNPKYDATITVSVGQLTLEQLTGLEEVIKQRCKQLYTKKIKDYSIKTKIEQR